MSVDTATVLDTTVATSAMMDSATVLMDSSTTAATTVANSSVTIKSMLAAHESEIVIIFAVIVYSVILFKVISVIISAIKAGKVQTTPASETVHVDSGENAGSIKLIDVDEKTAAQIMAIVAHESEVPVDQLIFKSIKALN